MPEPAVKVVAMPKDTNPNGDMFGGWVISMMDLAGYLGARKLTAKRLVTVAMDNIIFHNPVFVGDCLECHTTVERVGNTSITVRVEAFVERMGAAPDADKPKVTEGSIVYVAIGDDRKPVSLGLAKTA